MYKSVNASSLAMRKALLLVLLIMPVLFAAWTESIVVNAIDKMDRPISNAVVTILYQKRGWPITADESSFDGSVVLITNKSGKVVFSFANMVDTPEKEIRYYIVKANYSTLSQQSEKVVCTSIGSKCRDNPPYIKTFTFDAYRVNIKVQDQDGKPLQDAVVYTASGNYTTDERGEAWVSVPNGATYSMVVEYGGRKRTISGKISGRDDNQLITLNRYEAKFRVLNDMGNVIPADVLVDGIAKHTDESGHVEFKNIISDNIYVFIRYAGGVREYNITISKNIDQELIIDETAPTVTISGKVADEKQKAIFISAVVTDPNPKASGLRHAEPVVLKYNAGEGWKSINMYQTGRETFQATLPLVYDTKIMFEISAYDSQDNMNTISDSIFVKRDGGAITENKTGQPTGVEQPQQQDGLDIITLTIGIIIVLIVLLILYKKYTGEI